MISCLISAAYATDLKQTSTVQRFDSLAALIEFARQNDIADKVSDVTIEKMEIDQSDAYKQSTYYVHEGDERNEVLREYRLSVLKPARADKALKKAKLLQLKQRDQLYVDVENAVSGYVLAKTALDVQQKAIELQQKKVDAMALKLDLGLVVPLDLIEAESELAQAKLNVLDYKNDVADKLLQIKKVVGADFNADIAVPYQLQLASEQVEDIAQNIDAYVARRIDVITAKDNLEVEQGLFDIVAQYFPKNLKQYKETALQLLKAQNAYDKALKNARIDIQAAYDQLQIDYKNYQIAEEIVNITKRQYESDQKKLELGVISDLDLAVSAQNLLQRQLDVARKIHTYNAAKRSYLLNLKLYKVNIAPVEYDAADYFEVNGERIERNGTEDWR